MFPTQGSAFIYHTPIAAISHSQTHIFLVAVEQGRGNILS